MTKPVEPEPEGLSALARVTLALWVFALPAWMIWHDGLPGNTEELERWLSAFVSAGTIWAAFFARDAILKAIAAAIARVVGAGLAPISARLARIVEILRKWASASGVHDVNVEQALREVDALEAEIQKLSQPPRSRTIWQWLSGVFSAVEGRIRSDGKAGLAMPEERVVTTSKLPWKHRFRLAIIGALFCFAPLAMLLKSDVSWQEGKVPGSEIGPAPNGGIHPPEPLPIQRWVLPEASVWETLRSCGVTGNLSRQILAVRDANMLDCPNVTPGFEVCRIKEGEPLLLPDGVQCDDRPIFQSRDDALHYSQE